jgi:hypothetical protein
MINLPNKKKNPKKKKKKKQRRRRRRRRKRRIAKLGPSTLSFVNNVTKQLQRRVVQTRKRDEASKAMAEALARETRKQENERERRVCTKLSEASRSLGARCPKKLPRVKIKTIISTPSSCDFFLL